jgi:hypothetical protein
MHALSVFREHIDTQRFPERSMDADTAGRR